MPRRSRTSRTCSTVTASTRRRSAAAAITAAFCALTLHAAQAQTPSLQSILAARTEALRAANAHDPKTLQLQGLLSGAGLEGAFQMWSSGASARDDEQIGARSEETLQNAGGDYVVDENGNVRRLRGLLAQRRRTETFIDSGGFVSQPQYDKLLGAVTLPGGRSAFAIAVQPPDGLPMTVALDARTAMIDRISFDAEDGTDTEDFYDYHVFHGALVAEREIDSNGDHLYDVSRAVTRVVVDAPLRESLFAVPPNSTVQTASPVTVPLQEHTGHYYVNVRIHGHPYWFLLDTGAQGIVLDTNVATELGLRTEGHLEVAGAKRTGGLGLAQLDGLRIGSALLPLHTVTVLDLSNATGAFQADGVLGYPFFASAEVTIDAGARTMTFGKPGTLHAPGTPLDVDVDRQLLECDASVNGVPGRFVLDTGNSSELLLFAPFMNAHPGIVPPAARPFADNYGVGGSVRAVAATIDELDLGPYRFFNRYANIMLAMQGAFADRFDAGNVGMGVLQNFVVTIDEADAKIYLQKARAFDDGRYRTRTERIGIP